MRKAFTLMEVNLAVMVMAFGVLGLISLYSLGYRESSQSREDVEAAALAERNMNALATMLSSTNMSWTAWSSIGTLPAGGERNSGWMAYFNVNRSDYGNQDSSGADSNPSAKAQEVCVRDCQGQVFWLRGDRCRLLHRASQVRTCRLSGRASLRNRI